jgi:hypothetical protein
MCVFSRVPPRIALGVPFRVPPTIVVPLGVPAEIPTTFPAAVGVVKLVIVVPIIAVPSRGTTNGKSQEEKHS